MAETLRELRRAQIISAARALVSERGLHALTIAALEERLSFSRGVITYHFRNKDEIVDAVLQSAIDEIDAATQTEFAAATRLEAQLRAVLHANVRGYLDHPEAASILITYWGRLRDDPNATRLNAELYATYRGQSRALLEAARARGELAEEADVDATAALMVGLVIGVVLQLHIAPDAFAPDRAVEAAVAALGAHLRAS